MTEETPHGSADSRPTAGEPRPRPQYGEYATPQDQAKAMGLSAPPLSAGVHGADNSDGLDAPDATARVDRLAHGGQVEGPAAATDSVQAPARKSAMPATGFRAQMSAPQARTPRDPAKPRRWDFILTSILLAYATWNVVSQVFLASDLSGVINQYYEANSIGAFTPTELSAALGSVLNVVTILLFVVTVFVTSRLLRSGRLAFWVPIAGGALSVTVALVFVAVVVMGDPAFLAYSAKIGQ